MWFTSISVHLRGAIKFKTTQHHQSPRCGIVLAMLPSADVLFDYLELKDTMSLSEGNRELLVAARADRAWKPHVDNLIALYPHFRKTWISKKVLNSLSALMEGYVMVILRSLLRETTERKYINVC